MKKPLSPFQNRLRYEFDKTLSRGPMALGAWVALFSLLLVLLLAVLAHFARLDPALNLPQIFWVMLLQALAPNPVDLSLGPWPFLLLMLLITLIGIFMVSIFIGIITNSIDGRVNSLRKGRSQILEKDHTVILGWDEHIFTILRELKIANEHVPHACVAILGEKDKVEMEEEIYARLGNGTSHKMRIVCRNGTPIDMIDLDIVQLNAAKSIIVLAPDNEDADTYVIKALLAIINNPRRRAQPYHIVTEIHDVFNLEAAHLVGKQEATILLMSDIIAHITAQTCRQSGLSVVYTELLNFEGDEIYFHEEPSLVGLTFGEILSRFEDSAVMGVLPKGGVPKLNPPMDTLIQSGDQMIAISEEQSTLQLSSINRPLVQANLINVQTPCPAERERTLILGWNKRAATIIAELDNYVSPGSAVMVVAGASDPQSAVHQLSAALKNQSVAFQMGNTADRRFLNSLQVESYKHVIVLADLDHESVQMADAHTIITLLHLRDLNERNGYPFSIVSEMLDVRNRDLAEVTHVDDFIVSDELASLLLAQISEDKELSLVFEDLFYPAGSEIFLKPITDYILPGHPVNFYTVVEAVRQRGEVAIGYRIVAFSSDPAQSFGIVVNPNKSDLVTFHPDDRVIVLAEF